MPSLALGGGKRGNRGLTQSILDDGHTHLPGDNHGDVIRKGRGKEINICDPFSESEDEE